MYVLMSVMPSSVCPVSFMYCSRPSKSSTFMQSALLRRI